MVEHSVSVEERKMKIVVVGMVWMRIGSVVWVGRRETGVVGMTEIWAAMGTEKEIGRSEEKSYCGFLESWQGNCDAPVSLAADQMPGYQQMMASLSSQSSIIMQC